jgi:hypothetical protein
MKEVPFRTRAGVLAYALEAGTYVLQVVCYLESYASKASRRRALKLEAEGWKLLSLAQMSTARIPVIRLASTRSSLLFVSIHLRITRMLGMTTPLRLTSNWYFFRANTSQPPWYQTERSPMKQ